MYSYDEKIAPRIDVRKHGDLGRQRRLQPSGWPQPKGYSNGMTAEGRLIVTGGVVGWDAAEQFASSFAGQVELALHNIVAILAEGGARPEHVVRLWSTWTNIRRA